MLMKETILPWIAYWNSCGAYTEKWLDLANGAKISLSKNEKFMKQKKRIWENKNSPGKIG